MKNKVKKTYDKNSLYNILMLVFSILAHVTIILLLILSYKYYKLEVKTFIGIIGIIVCLLIIGDILFYIGLKYKEMRIKIINIVLCVLLLIVGSGGSFYVHKINKAVNNVIDNSGTDQYEIIGGVFAHYKNTDFSDLEDLKSASNLTIGVLYDSGIGTGSMAKEIIKENSINATVETYNTTDDLLAALVGEDSEIDVAVFPASYRQRLLSVEDTDYSQYLDDIIDFYSFEDKVKTGENENSGADLYTEPFNILLIGFAPENEDMTYGLADSIIVATVNPQTFTVSMTSIARDSYVPIACYGGNTREKINAARGQSRQCLMETVEDLLDIEINYYMEVNFLGVVEIVDAVGGIIINNEVEFVGQSASTERGNYTVLVPAGENIVADGEMALAFARERHAAGYDDFTRQRHQQEVIAAIVEKLLGMSSVNEAVKVMEAAGNNMSTNLSLDQLTGIFNYLVNHKNTTGISTYNMIDIQNMRITGYSSWTYNYSMRLPLWIYKLYNGSIAEAKERIDDVMNNYTTSDISQKSYFKFFANYPYSRGQLYSTYFDEVEEHEELPSYYPYLTKYTYSEALAWASANGVTLEVTFISNDSSSYVASQDGMVVDQSPRQGALTSENPVGYITVMGNQDPNYVPEYEVTGCNDEASCKAFAESKGITVSYEYKTDTENAHTEGEYYGTNYKNGEKIKKSETLVIYKWTKKVAIPSYSGVTLNDYIAKLTKLGLDYTTVTTTTNATSENNGTIASVSPTTTANAGDTITITVYKYDAPAHVHNYATEDTSKRIEPTCEKEGSATYVCSCGDTKTVVLDKKTEGCPTSGGDTGGDTGDDTGKDTSGDTGGGDSGTDASGQSDDGGTSTN